MNILPIPTVRVSALQRATGAASSISAAEAQLQTVGQQLSSGEAISVPSDDPSAAVVIQTLKQQLGDDTQYAANVTAAQNQLGDADTTLGSLTTLLTQAVSTASQNLSSTNDATARAAAADTVDSIYAQVASTANTTYGGKYLFGGDDANAVPYVATAYGFQYNASGATLSAQTDTFATLDYQVSGQSVFGGLSASVSAGTNIAPALAATDRVADLAGARNNGVTLGTVDIGNGTTTAAVDLTGADTLQGVVDDINNAAIAGVTASVTATGLKLTATGGANITVTDPDGGTAAADLGILHATASGAGVAVTGSAVNARVTQTTPLAALRGGAGIDPTGFTIGNGSTSKTISLTGLTTVQDLVNAVNTSGLGVRATIRADGTGIDLQNATQGADLTVSEAGGTTAAELGFITFKPATLLSSLNKGVGVAAPAGTQFTLATADGSKIDVGLTGITATSTVQDAVDQINTAAAPKVTASLNTTGNGIVLTDHTTGPGKLAVADANAASTADELGLTGGTVAGNVLTGTDPNPVATPGLLTDLNDLRVALRQNDTAGIETATAALRADSVTVTTVQAVVGSRVQELNSRQATLATQQTSTQTLLSSYQDVDYTTATTQYQELQTSLQASMLVTSRTMSLSLMDYLA